MSNDNNVIERSMSDPSAFGEIFHRHAPVLHRYVARRAGETVADDVTSETFLVAFRRRGKYDLSREDARPWLFGIATNLMHRHRIAEARTLKSLERLESEPTSVDTTHLLDDAMDAAGTIKELAHALRKLPKGDRDALLLYAWADFSYEEIAQALKIPVGTVRSRLNRTRRILKATPIVTTLKEGNDERVQYASDIA